MNSVCSTVGGLFPSPSSVRPYGRWIYATALVLSLCGRVFGSGLIEQWRQRYVMPGPSEDRASLGVVDPQGNVIVAGYTDTGRQGADVLIIKYSTGGVPIWTNQFNAGSDYPADMLCANGGNVYVAVRSHSADWSLSIVTLVYSSQGVLLWTNSFGTNSMPSALAVDNGGQVYVTGRTIDPGNWSTVTIAYSTNGAPLWTNRYQGVTAYDTHREIRVAGNGDVLVAGSSSSNEENYEYWIIRYSSDGTPLSTNSFESLGSTPNAMVLDGNGTLYLAGTGLSNANRYYYIAAYFSNSLPVWTNIFGNNSPVIDSPVAITIGQSGNIVVTGVSRAGFATEYTTLAYSQNGMPLWTNRYARSNGLVAQPTALAINPDTGSVYVAGVTADTNWSTAEDFTVVAYSGAGVPLWTNSYGTLGAQPDYPRSIVSSGIGPVFVAGYDHVTDDDFVTLAYTAAGVPLWTNRYTEKGIYSSAATGVVVDGSGNAYVVGRSTTNGFACMLTIAYSSAGVPLWTNSLERADGRDIALLPSGNIVVTGLSSTGDQGDILTMAYSSLGTSLWTNRYSGPANAFDFPLHVLPDENGDIFILGSSYDGTSINYVTLAYSSGGVPLWTNRYKGNPEAICVSSNGNVYVTGDEQSTAVTIGYSNNGVPLWTNRFTGLATNASYTYAIAADHLGNVHVTAASAPPAGSDFGSDFATISYSSLGIPLYTNYAGGPEHDTPAVIVADQNGNFVVSGESAGFGSDFLTVAYSMSGTPLWTNRYPLPLFSGPIAMVVNSLGDIIVSGNSSGSIVSLGYSSHGTLLWTEGPTQGSGLASAHCLRTTPDGGLLMAVSADGDASPERTTDITLTKYLIAPIVRLRALEYLPNAGFHLVISTRSNTSFALQTSADLINWVTLTNFSHAPAETIDFTDITASGVSTRFYRALLQP